MWIEASQGPDYTQRLPARVAPESRLNTAVGRKPAHLESIAFLKGVVEHPSQYYADEEPDNAKLQAVSIVSEASAPTSSLGNDDSASSDVEDGAEPDDSQRTKSDTSSDNVLREVDEESEVRC